MPINISRTCPGCGETVTSVAKACPTCDAKMTEKAAPGVQRATAEANRACLTCGRFFATKAERDLHKVEEHGRKSKKVAISTVADTSSGEPACPKCGGTDFKVKRSGKQKAALGVLSLAVKGSQVRCTLCGTVYKRG